MQPSLIKAAVLAAALAATLSACSTQPRPDAALAASSASLEAAQAAGANDLAPLALQQAQAKLARARLLAQAGQHRDAIRLAEQAQADAQLARAQAASERSRRAAEEVQASLRSLREELNRSAVGMPTAPVRSGAPSSLPAAPVAPYAPAAPAAPLPPGQPRSTP